MNSTDLNQLLQIKTLELEELNEQFSEYQQQSNLIIGDLQCELKEVKKKYEAITRQLHEVKDKKKQQNGVLEKEIEMTKKEREQFRNKFVEFEKKVIELENINQNLQNDLRATKAVLFQYEQRTEKTMEELALLQIQMEENTESNQEQIARLRSQLKETEDELFALHHAKQVRDELHGSIQMQLQPHSSPCRRDESFQSGKEYLEERRSSITESKIKKKSGRFGETLAEIRNYIKQISGKREELDKRFS